MAIDLTRFQRLKEQSDKAKTEVDKATGALEEQLSKLKSEFGLDTLNEAKLKLEEMDASIVELEGRYNKLLTDLETKWKGKL